MLRSHGNYEWTCFLAQQAAEKAAKALHQSVGTEAWGHSVGELLQGWEEVPSDVMQAGRAVDKHYIAPRYPNAHPAGAPRDTYTELDADRAIEDAMRVIEFVRSRLPSD